MMITLTQAQWKTIFAKLKAEHPPSVVLIRTKMRDELGFTTRTGAWDKGGWIVHLDFFDEAKETFFRMKYL